MKLNKLFILLLAVIYLSGCGKTILPSENEQEEETEKETPSSSPVDDETVYSVEEFIVFEFGENQSNKDLKLRRRKWFDEDV